MSVSIRAMRPEDHPAWLRFVSDIPRGEERFLKEDPADPATLERWARDAGRAVAIEDGEIVGAVVALPGEGWSAHVAELRLVVAGSHRRRGLGRELAGHGLRLALEQGCTHVYVEVIAEQDPLVAMFRSLGFRPEALLEGFVRYGDEYHDLMLLTHNAPENWAALSGLGLGDAD